MKAIVLAGGGIDSAVCIGMSVKEFGAEKVYALSFEYGQKHNIEIEVSRKLCEYYGAHFECLDLTKVFEKSKSFLLKNNKQEVPYLSYANQTAVREGSSVVTCVPFRSGVFISVATSVALSLGCEAVIHGINRWSTSKDAYPDGSTFFHITMSESVHVGSGGCVKLLAPFLNEPKDFIVSYGHRIGVPFKYSYSCYEGRKKHCGACVACRERLLSFEKNNIEDPAEYEAI